MAFKDMMNDSFSLVKNGEIVKEGIKGSIQKKQVITFETSLPFAKNDNILRELPNGLVESYIIDDPVFNQGQSNSIPPFYDILVHKSDQSPDTKSNTIQHIQNINNNFSGNDNIINVNSPGSTFIKDTSLFDRIAEVVTKEVEDESDKEKLLAIIDQLAKSKNKGEFADHYNDLIQKAANYMTVLSPFIPQLTLFLTVTGS